MLNKRCIFLVPFNHRQRIDRINQRAVGGIGGSAFFLHDAHLAGDFLLRALGNGGEEGIFFRLQISNPNIEAEGGTLFFGKGVEVLQEVVQEPAM